MEIEEIVCQLMEIRATVGMCFEFKSRTHFFYHSVSVYSFREVGLGVCSGVRDKNISWATLKGKARTANLQL